MPPSFALDVSQIAERQTVLRAALDLQPNNPVPFLVEPFSMWYASEELLNDHALDLARQIARNEAQAEVNDYSLPHLKPGAGLGAIATAFGCGFRSDPVADPWVLPLVGENAESVYRLQLPDTISGGLIEPFLHKVAYFEANSNLPLCACNIPSPLTTASMIWDYSHFLQALLDHPREVHYLLDLITEYTILFLRANEHTIQNLWGLTHMNWYLPREAGLRVSDDVLAVISPRQYREFGVPYNNRLSDAFGGIVIHSCGNIVHNLQAILETRGLRGIEATLPHNDIHKLAAFTGQTTFMLRYWLQDWDDQQAPDLEQYTEEALSILGTRGIMLEMQVPTRTTEEAADLAARLREQDWRS
jgi:hypothetical protein